MATDKNGKLTFQIKSPGEAWMDHVNNDLNAKAVTPAYLEPNTAKGPGVARINKCIQELKEQQNGAAVDKARSKMVQKDSQETIMNKDKDKEVGLSR